MPIVMITRDRAPKRNYLFDTIDSFERSGVFKSEHFHSFTILDDCSSGEHIKAVKEHIKELPIQLVEHDEIAGSKGNAARAHRLLHSLQTEWGMVIEDDITVCSRFLESVVVWLNDHQTETRRLYLMGVPDIPQGHKKSYYETNSFFGSQCYVVRTIDSLSISEFLDNTGPYNNGHDTKLMKWLKKTYDKKYHKVCSPFPTLVQHIGVESTIQRGERAKAYPHFHFIGEDKKYHRKK